jgi:hypothetical protein
MIIVWFGNVLYSFLKKVEFPIALIYAVSEKIRKKAWWQHHQTKLPMARMPAMIHIHTEVL